MSTLKVTNIESPSGGGVNAKIADVNGGQLSNRNLIINGSMEVAQRGTSSTTTGYGSLDRWRVNQSGGTTTFSQETFAAGSEIGSLKNYARFNVTASSDFTSIRQRIEDVRSVPAGTITISFQAKGTNPSGNLAVYLTQNFGSGGSSDVDIAAQTVTLTSSWQRFDLQFTVPSISGKTIGTSSFFELCVGQHSNTGTSAFDLNITGVQLELGEVATAFEHRSYSDELARCQRYFETSYPVGTAPGATQTHCPLSLNAKANQFRDWQDFKVTKRAVPTMKFYSPDTGTVDKFYNANSTSELTAISDSASHNGARVSTNSTAAVGDLIRWQYTAEAEL